jgi:hypothetical protein
MHAIIKGKKDLRGDGFGEDAKRREGKITNTRS